MRIAPRGKRILVKRDDPKSRVQDNGLVAPDSVEQEQKAFGTVISVGSEIKDVKKGDRVIYGAYAGEEIETLEKGKKVVYRLLEDEDVIAHISE